MGDTGGGDGRGGEPRKPRSGMGGIPAGKKALGAQWHRRRKYKLVIDFFSGNVLGNILFTFQGGGARGE